MISSEEIAQVKDKLNGFRLSPTNAGSMRQLELMFLVAHDEIGRLEKYESRAKLVIEKWELLKSCKIIAYGEAPNNNDNFSVTESDVGRCAAALEILFPPSPAVLQQRKIQQQQNQNTAAAAASSSSSSSPPSVTATPSKNTGTGGAESPTVVAHSRRKQKNPNVYMDDEFSYDQDDGEDFSSIGGGSRSPSRHTSLAGTPERNRLTQQQQQSPQKQQQQQQGTNNEIAAAMSEHEATQTFLETLSCCKFISALPLAVYQLAFLKEGDDYASVALAAALDEVKLFQAQLRSSQECFVNLRECWNHEIRKLSLSTGVDLSGARVVLQQQPQHIHENQNAEVVGSNERQFSSSANNTNNNNEAAAASSSSSSSASHAPARVDQMVAAESADGGSWLAPPLLPLKNNFAFDSSDLFSGYAGPTLLGPVVSKGTLLHEIQMLGVRQLESDERNSRGELEQESLSEFMSLQTQRANRSESMWTEAQYDKTSADLRLLEAKEEIRKLKAELAKRGDFSSTTNSPVKEVKPPASPSSEQTTPRAQSAGEEFRDL